MIPSSTSSSSLSADKTDSVRIEQSEAGIFMQAGRGRRVSRLQLGTDSRFYISAFASNWTTYLRGKIGTIRGRLIPIKDNNNQTIFVSIRSLCRRLHVREEDVREAVQNGRFNLSYIREKIEKFNKAAPAYDQIVDAIQKKTKTELVDIDTLTLWKIFDKVSEEIDGERAYNKSIKSLYFPMELRHVKNLADGTYYFNIDNAKKTTEIIALSKKLGEGGFGQAWQIDHVKEKETTEVAKYVEGDSHVEEVREKIKEIDNEREKLESLNAKGPRWGIQAKPRKVIDMTRGDVTKARYGYIGMKYDGSYDSEFSEPTSVENIFLEFHQLLLGLAQMAALDILHGDIKPQNIFFKKDEDGTRLLHIADFGGSRFANNELRNRKTFTTPCSSETDLRYWLFSTDEREKIVRSEKGRDVFSMGYILYCRLTNSHPYPLDMSEINNNPIIVPRLYENNNIAYRPITRTRTDIPTEISTLIQEMLHPDYTKRPTADEAFQRFDSFLKTNYSVLHTEIGDKIKKDYAGTGTEDSFSGKRTYIQGEVVKEGTFRYGLLNGNGEKRVKGDTWKGAFKNDVLHGRGEIILANGNRCEGVFDEGVLNGPTKLKIGDTTLAFNAVNGRIIKDLVEITLPGRGIWQGQLKESELVEEVLKGLKTFSGADIDGVGEFTDLQGKKLRGMFTKGRLNGVGEIVFPQGSVYKGIFKNGQLQGKGTISPIENGRAQIAVTFRNNQVTKRIYWRLSRGGDGKGGGIFYPDGRIEGGVFKKGKLADGKAEIVFPNGICWKGTWKNGAIAANEEVSMTFADGLQWKGTLTAPLKMDALENFKVEQITGKGILTYRDGTVKTGSFVNGLLNGNGSWILKDGGEYRGMFKDGKMDGRGSINIAGNTVSGTFKNDQLSKDTIPTCIFNSDNEKIMGKVIWKGNLELTGGLKEMVEKLTNIDLKDLNGKGQLHLQAVYLIGTFREGKLHGEGEMLGFPAWKGNFDNNKLKGKKLEDVLAI